MQLLIPGYSFPWLFRSYLPSDLGSKAVVPMPLQYNSFPFFCRILGPKPSATLTTLEYKSLPSPASRALQHPQRLIFSLHNQPSSLPRRHLIAGQAFAMQSPCKHHFASLSTLIHTDAYRLMRKRGGEESKAGKGGRGRKEMELMERNWLENS